MPIDLAHADKMIEQLQLAIVAERERSAELRAALEAVLADIEEYEHANNLAPNPGRSYCWDSVARAYAAIRKGDVHKRELARAINEAAAAERERNAQKCDEIAAAAKRRGGTSYQALECAAAIRRTRTSDAY